MKRFLLLAAAAVALAQQPNTQDANYYAPEDDARVGQRLATQLQTNITAATEPRLDQIGNRLAAHSPQFRYRFSVFDGGQPSQDTAPAAAFPADWRRLQLDEAIAVAGGMIFVPRALLSRDDAQVAAILAHAIGHIALRHPTVGMTRGELAQVEVQVASRAMPDEAPQRVHAVALKRFAFDRACETAADGVENASALRAFLKHLGLAESAVSTLTTGLLSSQRYELKLVAATSILRRYHLYD
jgi:Zn-dependent protease with chaperone function